MLLRLNLKGSVEPFISYLKNYLRIRESLLLEIDTNTRAFVAKTYTEDKSSVRFSSIMFDDANITIVSDDGEETRGDSRIKVGILIQLKKFIQIIERLGADLDKDGNANFNIEIEYDQLVNQKDSSVDFIATSISFKSDILTMRMDGFRPSEFTYLPDEKFLGVVFNVKDPISMEVSPDTINSIIKTSDIVKIDVRKDALVFYVDGNALYVKDRSNDTDKKPNFVYKIGDLEDVPEYEVSVPITRDRFTKMFEKTDEGFKIIIGKSVMGDSSSVDRVLFDSTKTTTKIVIAAMKDY